ncbi:heme peroxidase superfamily protein [Mycolicibacterium rhodesiae JS60]|nr:heme peroxidase superfamily protein [Mycolicibacterium rhodesiae JS60]
MRDDTDLAALVKVCETDLGDSDLWFRPDGYPDSLALCIIDSIYSTGARYSSVVNVVRRYRDHRTQQGGTPDMDGTEELAANIAELGGPDAWASRIGNRRPTSTTAGAPLKAETIDTLTTVLPEHGLRTTADLRSVAADAAALKTVERAWRATPGQRSGITWDYALMLAQIPGVKADRMVIRYVARAIGVRPDALPPQRAADMIKRVAEMKAWEVVHLDYAIWRFESGRPHQNLDDAAGSQ